MSQVPNFVQKLHTQIVRSLVRVVIFIMLVTVLTVLVTDNGFIVVMTIMRISCLNVFRLIKLYVGLMKE